MRKWSHVFIERDRQTANTLGRAKARYVTHAKTGIVRTAFVSCLHTFSIVNIMLFLVQSRVLLDMVVLSRLVKKFPAFLATRSF